MNVSERKRQQGKFYFSHVEKQIGDALHKVVLILLQPAVRSVERCRRIAL